MSNRDAMTKQALQRAEIGLANAASYDGRSMPRHEVEDIKAALSVVRSALQQQDAAHSKSEFKRRVAMGDPNVLPPQQDAGALPTDADGERVTPQRLIAWLDAKYARHHEEEDKWAADYIRATMKAGEARDAREVKRG